MKTEGDQNWYQMIYYDKLALPASVISAVHTLTQVKAPQYYGSCCVLPCLLFIFE
jgi:hypothetical protein